MSKLLRHPAVDAAYQAGEYTDQNGTLWKRGMDGWFHHTKDLTAIVRHDDMVKHIEAESGDDE